MQIGRNFFEGFETVFVCLCNALTDRDICQAAETCKRVADVYQSCGCQPDCGKCVPYVRDLLRAKAEANAGLGLEATACDPDGESRETVAA